MKNSLLQLLKPNRLTLGFALFLATNATSVWGGVFHFLPMGFQTTEVLLWFFIAQASTFFLAFLAATFINYQIPERTRQFHVLSVDALYALGWICIIAALYLPRYTLVLMIAGGVLIGAGSAGFYIMFQRIFAAQADDSGPRNLVLGTVYSAVMYFVLTALPTVVVTYLIPTLFLPTFSLVIVLESRQIDLEQPMFQDVPKAHAHVYRASLRDAWPSILGIAGIGFCSGVMRAVAIDDPSAGSLINLLSMMAALIAGLCILFIWSRRNITISIATLYRYAYPIIIILFVVMPLFSGVYTRSLAAILYALHTVALMLMMMLCSQISRDNGISPTCIYGVFGAAMYGLHDIGFIGSSITTHAMFDGIAPLALTSLVAVSALALLQYAGALFRGNASSGRSDTNIIELLAVNASANKPVKVSGGTAVDVDVDEGAEASAPAAATDEAAAERRHDGKKYKDRLSKAAEAARLQYRLSTRETEIMEYIARGNTVAVIAQTLFVSENTVRTHAKRIYAKMDIHKRQELVELLETIDTTGVE